ncbi:GDP-fucose O-fucosyltransferase-like protein, partial [Trifolium medium]|nr:GDP-fucose O-fucosyltransferase-like protein [Trifolium medium]
SISPMNLRKKGRCPLTPEEAALVLAGLGFKQETYIYLAGSHIYGGNSRMEAFNRLYPNVVTKENLLTTTELAPFRNFSSQVWLLDLVHLWILIHIVKVFTIQSCP